jgi:hypothetical protein
MIELILNVSFMFSGCLGALDSNSMDDVVDHEYDTLPPSTLDACKATPGKSKNIHDQLLQFPVSSQFLINPRDQVNTSLGPRATKHSMTTPAWRQKTKVSRQLKAHKKKDNIKRKEAEEFSKLEVNIERLTPRLSKRKTARCIIFLDFSIQKSSVIKCYSICI